LLTNSSRKRKRGPKEAHAGSIYAFAQQAYWGFRFLAEKRKSWWKQVLEAEAVATIQEIGRSCSQDRAIARAGYGAAGLMTWLTKRSVALQVLAAKSHRRYPDSERPSSKDRKMISLAIAVGGGMWGVKYSTALRKLAEAGLGLEHLAREVHGFDRFKENMRRQSLVFAEPLGNYFFCSPRGERRQIQKLPCKVPPDCRVGFIIHGYGPNGPQSTYSSTLPPELLASLLSQEKERPTSQRAAIGSPQKISVAPNSVKCRCGAEISAQTQKLAVKALAEHKRIVHSARRLRRDN
jgi:hypothetical protein